MIRIHWNCKKKHHEASSNAKYEKGFYLLYCSYKLYRFQMLPLGAFDFEKTILDQFSCKKSWDRFFALHLQVCFCLGKAQK